MNNTFAFISTPNDRHTERIDQSEDNIFPTHLFSTVQRRANSNCASFARVPFLAIFFTSSNAVDEKSFRINVTRWGNDPRCLSRFANGGNKPPHRICDCAIGALTRRYHHHERMNRSLRNVFSISFSFGSLSRRRASHFYRRVALKIMTRHSETRLAALRPFPQSPVQPESRYVYVCGNVSTPAAICNILLRFFFITPCDLARALSFSHSFSFTLSLS